MIQVKHKNRISLSYFFFVSGLSFASWASRIPDIKESFHFNEAELGSVLFVMPISSLMGLPISGWLVNKFDSRLPMFFGLISQITFLVIVGFANTTNLLMVGLFTYAFATRIINIAMNTQSIVVQKLFDKKIIGSFHGLWSAGGIVAVGFSTLIIPLGIDVKTHFLIIAGFVFITSFFAFKNSIRNDVHNASKGFVLKRPDGFIINLGLITICAAICEGGMFDWSGVYFKEVVNVELYTTGYFTFMTCMALSRFASDNLIQRLGMKLTFILSSLMIATGLTIAISFPSFIPALVGFALVGIGTASVVPMVFTLAGNSPTYSPGIAISILSTFGMIGIMLGPPLIGYIAHLINLRASFVMVAGFALLIVPGTLRFFKKYSGQLGN